MSKAVIGTHCILELAGCPFELLDDEAVVRAAIEQASGKAKATLLTLSSHKFEPQGVTALGLLAESHISIHTWPEQGYAAVDIFTCGDSAEPREACDFLARYFKAQAKSLAKLPRGSRLATPLVKPAFCGKVQDCPTMA